MPLSSVVGASSILRPGVCTSTSRPASPFEGQTIYETDTDRLATWDGSAWIPYVRQTAGKVLQVVSTTKTDTFSASVGAGGETEVTGLSATITPSATSSKVLVIANVHKGTYGGMALKRDTTLIGVGDTAGNRIRLSSIALATNGSWGTPTAQHVLDSPATTSATTYKVFLRQQNNTTLTLYCNRSDSDTDNNENGRYASSITVMEISG